jgi:hypothetical protein
MRISWFFLFFHDTVIGGEIYNGLTSTMIQYNASNLVSKVLSNTCSLVAAGATWDGHFKAWCGFRSWVRIEKILLDSKNFMKCEIDIGYFLYNHHLLPKITEDAWTQPSIGSYDIVIFKRNQTLQRKYVNELLRPPRSHEQFTDMELLQILEGICCFEEKEEKTSEVLGAPKEL